MRAEGPGFWGRMNKESGNWDSQVLEGSRLRPGLLGPGVAVESLPDSCGVGFGLLGLKKGARSELSDP